MSYPTPWVEPGQSALLGTAVARDPALAGLLATQQQAPDTGFPTAAPSGSIMDPNAHLAPGQASDLRQRAQVAYAMSGLPPSKMQQAFAFAMALPNRAWDTLFIAGQHAKYVDPASNFNWGVLADRDAWSQAWTYAGEPGHVTAGQITSSALTRGYGGDPLVAQQAQAIQQNAGSTWYGQTLAGATDLTASLTVPGMGVLRRIKAGAQAVRSIDTLTQAEHLAEVEKAAYAAGETFTKPTVAQKMAQAAKNAVPFYGTRVAAPAAHVLGGLTDFANATDSFTTRGQMLDALDVVMEGSTPEAKVAIANIWTEANRAADPALRTHLKVNAVLAAQGSSAARAELVQEFPTLAASMEHMTGAPVENELLAKMADARLSADPAADTTTVGILAEAFSTDAATAERIAAMNELEKARAAAEAARKAADIAQYGGEGLVNIKLATDELNTAQGALLAAQRAARPASEIERLTAAVADKQSALDAATSAARESQSAVGITAEHASQAASSADAAEAAVTPAEEAFNVAKGTEEALRQKAREAGVGLYQANALLDQIMSLGSPTGAMAVGRVAPNAMDSLKISIRQRLGQSYTMRLGDGNTLLHVMDPIAARLISPVAKGLSPRAAGALNLHELSLGVRQLREAMRRSKAFDPQEIEGVINNLISAAPAARAHIADSAMRDMMTRIAERHAPPGQDPLKWAKDLTGMGANELHNSRAWTVEFLDAQAGNGHVAIPFDESSWQVVNEARLRSHVVDTVPFMDPDAWERSIQLMKLDTSLAQRSYETLTQINAAATNIWKRGVLMRGGLGTRALLDTELRSLALLTTAENITNAIDGTVNLLRNKTTLPLLRRLLDQMPVDEIAVKGIGTRLESFPIGNGQTIKTAFHSPEVGAVADELTRQSSFLAQSKGQSMSDVLMGMVSKASARLKLDRARWDWYEPDSPHWTVAYREFTKQWLASPSARYVIDKIHSGAARDIQELTRDAFSQAPVRSEYNLIARGGDVSKEEFIAQLVHEGDTLFPDATTLSRAKQGMLTDKYIGQRFPPGQRFRVAGPDSVVMRTDLGTKYKRFENAFFSKVLDKPDMWIARNPTATALWRRQLMAEAKKALAEHGPDHMITAEEFAVMDARAKTQAIQTVRRTFFDTTRYNGAHHAFRYLMPFFTPWEDALTSWGRLIYDDPSRLVKLSAAYNSTAILNNDLSSPVLVDQDGNRIIFGHQGSNQQAYIPVPILGTKTTMKINLQAFNSIIQGETWWLPGFSPQATLSVAEVLGNVLPPDVTLKIVGTDNWLGKQVLDSMFQNGEVPKTDWKSMTLSVLPSWMKNLANDTLGTNFAHNVLMAFNSQAMQALKSGKPITTETKTDMFNSAVRSAWAAAAVRLVSNFGLGLSGSAAVDGQFYMDQYHKVQSMTPAALKEAGVQAGLGPNVTTQAYFAHLYPEAGDLNWSMSTNETGISANVDAQKAFTQLDGLVAKYPELGWFVVGAANVASGQFSDTGNQTVYNKQVTDGYRKQYSGMEGAKAAVAASMVDVGWAKYTALMNGLQSLAQQYGVSMSDPRIRAAKQRFLDGMVSENPDWWGQYSTPSTRFVREYPEMLALANDPKLRSRQDMTIFREYDQFRTQVMQHFGIHSLTGTSEPYVQARAVLDEVGTKLSGLDLGFQQMWNRLLSSEVQPK